MMMKKKWLFLIWFDFIVFYSFFSFSSASIAWAGCSATSLDSLPLSRSSFRLLESHGVSLPFAIELFEVFICLAWVSASGFARFLKFLKFLMFSIFMYHRKFPYQVVFSHHLSFYQLNSEVIMRLKLKYKLLTDWRSELLSRKLTWALHFFAGGMENSEEELCTKSIKSWWKEETVRRMKTSSHSWNELLVTTLDVQPA